jgi:hypothetical protein
MRQKLTSVISCPNVAFQVALGHLKNAVDEGSDGIDAMETAKSTRKMKGR